MLSLGSLKLKSRVIKQDDNLFQDVFQYVNNLNVENMYPCTSSFMFRHYSYLMASILTYEMLFTYRFEAMHSISRHLSIGLSKCSIKKVVWLIKSACIYTSIDTSQTVKQVNLTVKEALNEFVDCQVRTLHSMSCSCNESSRNSL